MENKPKQYKFLLCGRESVFTVGGDDLFFTPSSLVVRGEGKLLVVVDRSEVQAFWCDDGLPHILSDK